jgi:hypothetical protein
MPPISHHRPAALARLRSLTHLLDNAIGIPGTPFRIGLDPLIGLLPGGGDLVGALFSVYIVLEAMQFGVPRATLTQMVVNLVLDAAVGLFPGLGDLLDVAWKANSRNLALLEAHIGTSQASPRPVKLADRIFIIVLLLGFLLVVVLIAALTTFLLTGLWQAVTR